MAIRRGAAWAFSRPLLDARPVASALPGGKPCWAKPSCRRNDYFAQPRDQSHFNPDCSPPGSSFSSLQNYLGASHYGLTTVPHSYSICSTANTMDGVSMFAATTQIAQQLVGIISATRSAIKDFRSAAEDHKTLSNEFSSIFKV